MRIDHMYLEGMPARPEATSQRQKVLFHQKYYEECPTTRVGNMKIKLPTEQIFLLTGEISALWADFSSKKW